jgi:hypothetical protein
MHRLFTRAAAAIAALSLSALLVANATAQQKAKITKDQLAGTWTFVSVYTDRADGSRFEPWGPKPNGSAMFAPNGRYSIVVGRPDVPKFAAKDRLKGTAEENQAAVQGILAHFGTWSVNEADGTFTMKVEGSSFPNDIGTEQKRLVETLSGDELTFVNPTPTTGAKAYVVWKKAAQ